MCEVCEGEGDIVEEVRVPAPFAPSAGTVRQILSGTLLLPRASAASVGTMRRVPLFAFIFSLALVATAAASTQHWELVDDSDGIRVWTLEIPGQDLPGFRGITTIHAGIEDIVKVMLDVEHHVDWMWQCDESRPIRYTAENRGLLYNRINAPWPVWDRDVVVDVAWRYTPNKEALTFRFRNVNEAGEPPQDGVVRLPRLEGFYRLWSEKPGVTNVLYQVEVDIAGNVPDFMARRYAKKLPYKTLEALRERVESGKH
jgi:hypothetical protein